jgi:methyl-accepting chemotaxis protein
VDDLKKVENALRALAMGVLAKYEKKKKVDNVQELVVLATYVNMKKLDEIKNDIEGVLRAFERLDSLVEVVKQLRSAVDNLQRGHLDEAVRLLKEVNAKLEEVAKRGEAFSIEEV